MYALSRYTIMLIAFVCLTTVAMRGRQTLIERADQSSMSALPKLFLWAWERPDDLRTLPPDVGAAYLAATLRVKGDRVITVPRMQPLMVPKATSLIAVVRIEVDELRRTRLSDHIAAQLCRKITRCAALPGVQGVQIDFDARQDEREFYADLLRSLRSELPASMPISITALASWCMCDTWMQKLPVDESVPMFFSMGRDTNRVLADTAANRKFGDRRCDKALGLSLDEAKVNAIAVPAARERALGQPIRFYIFSSRTWTSDLIKQAIHIAKGQL